MTTATCDLGTAHWELVRALGAFALTPPPANTAVCEALGIADISGAEHTGVFVLQAPPHAAIHLGPEGQLGGEGLDRVAGFWRALGLRAPEDADHLGTLLLLYAELGLAEHGAQDPRQVAQLRRSSTALLHEHLWSWAPGYLHAVSGLGVPAVAEWASLVHDVLADAAGHGPTALPLALREAPAALSEAATADEVLDALVSPIRSGLVMTQQDLQDGAAVLGLGFRRGERRYALRAMLDQDARATLRWAGRLAQAWAQVHQTHGADPISSWWRARAVSTATALRGLLAGSTDEPSRT